MEHSDQLTGEILFETERLRCRKWRLEDVDAIYRVYSDPVAARWIDDGQPIQRDECEAWLRITAKNYQTRGYGMFALEDPHTDETVGFCGLVHPGGQVVVEIKYAFLQSHWGRGLASEMIPALLSYGVETHRFDEVIATVAPENLASQRVLTKSGFAFVEEKADDDGELTRWFRWVRP